MDSAGGRPHVAFVAFPFGSHPRCLFSLARAIATACPSVAVSFLSTARALTSLPRGPADVDNLQLVAVSDGIPPSQTPDPADVENAIGMFLAATPANLRDGLDEAAAAAAARATCVVSDAFMWIAGEVADAMGAQWVAVWTSASSTLSVHLHTDAIRAAIGVGNRARADELLHFVPGHAVQRVRDIPEGIVFGSLDSPFSLLLHHMSRRLPKAAAVVLNTVSGLDPVADAYFETVFSKSLAMAPFRLLEPQAHDSASDPYRCLSWLDGRKEAESVAYVSFGSVRTPSPAELCQLAEGLENSGAPFLWSLKENALGHLPPGFLHRTKDRSLVVSWAPQLYVLRHRAVGAFVTHCGWNSVLEAITSGVPMVCQPMFGDQQMVARLVTAAWGMGIGFEGSVTEEEVVKHLDVVLNGEEGKAMRVKARELKAVADRAVAAGGSSVENFKRLLNLVCGCSTN